MRKNKINIKQIFGDNYQEFWENNKEKYPEKMRDNMIIGKKEAWLKYY